MLNRTRRRKQKSRESAAVRALPSHHSMAQVNARCHLWVEFVVGSCPCSEGFSQGSPVFLPPQKPTFQNSNSTMIEDLSGPIHFWPFPLQSFLLFLTKIRGEGAPPPPGPSPRSATGLYEYQPRLMCFTL